MEDSLVTLVSGKNRIVTSQRYASSVLAVVVCLCLSVTRRYYTETAERIELIFGEETSFDLS